MAHVLITSHSLSALDTSVRLLYCIRVIFSNIKKKSNSVHQSFCYHDSRGQIQLPNNICWILFTSTRFDIK